MRMRLGIGNDVLLDLIKDGAAMGNTPLNDLLVAIQTNARILRQDLKARATKTLDTLPNRTLPINGSVFIESVGTAVRFVDGIMESLYTPHAISARDVTIGRWNESRKNLFSKIAQQFPSQSRILNIGAGGDTTLIDVMKACKHEIISTDMAEDCIEILKNRTNTPAFAGDLLYINRLLPEPIPYIVGNSTLAYIESDKLATISENLVRIMGSGGVFTFDLAPHESYFNIVHQRQVQTLINESDANPRKLSEYVTKYGKQDGINAMAYFVFFQGYAVNLAVISCLRRLFLNLGCRCTTGVVRFTDEEGSHTTCFTLRVSKADDAILEPIEGEMLYASSTEEFFKSLQGSFPAYLIRYIDRQAGSELAAKLELSCDEQEAPWRAVEYIENYQDSRKLPEAVKTDVIHEMDPAVFEEMIWPYILKERTYVPPKAMDMVVAYDQMLHWTALSGQMEFSVADALIDKKYAEATIRMQRKAESRQMKNEKQSRVDERKRQKQARKKQRRK